MLDKIIIDEVFGHKSPDHVTSGLVGQHLEMALGELPGYGQKRIAWLRSEVV